MSRVRKPRGICPVCCRDDVPLRIDGTLSVHRVLGPSGQVHDCSGGSNLRRREPAPKTNRTPPLSAEEVGSDGR